MNRYPDMGSTALYAALGRATRRAGRATWPRRPARSALIYQLRAGLLRARRRGRLRLALLRGLPDRGHRRRPRRRVQVPVTADGRHDLDAMAAAVTDRTKVRHRLHAQQPDRPGGHPGRARRLPREGARRTCWSWSTRPTSSSSGWTTRSTASRPTARHDNVVLTRTFSKAYGLAGFRVGYAVAPAPIAAALRAVSLPFGVSHVAQAAAIASLERRGRAARAGRRAGRRARPASSPGCARSGWERARRAGQLRVVRARRAARSTSPRPATRSASSVRPFAGEGARVTIGEPEANDRLVEVAGPLRSLTPSAQSRRTLVGRTESSGGRDVPPVDRSACSGAGPVHPPDAAPGRRHRGDEVRRAGDQQRR